jgi:hypothetical protein
VSEKAAAAVISEMTVGAFAATTTTRCHRSLIEIRVKNMVNLTFFECERERSEGKKKKERQSRQ